MTRKHARAAALLAAALTPLAAHAATGTWANPAGGPWSDPLNWSGPIPNAPGDAAVLDTALLTSSTITLDAPRTLGSLTLNNSSASYTLATGTSGSLLLDNGTNPAALTISAGTHTIAAPIQLLSPLNMILNTNTSLTIASGIAGNQPLSVSGSGSLTLAGTNSFTSLSLSNPSVTIGSGGPADSPGTGPITFQSFIRFNLGAPATLSSPILGNGLVIHMGSAPLTLQAQNPWIGTFIAAAGSTAIADYSLVTSNIFSNLNFLVGRAESTLTLVGKNGAASAQTLRTIELFPRSTLNLQAGVGGSITLSANGLFLDGDVTINLPNAGATLSLPATFNAFNGRTQFNTAAFTTVNFNTGIASSSVHEFDLNGPGTFLVNVTNSHGTIFRPYVVMDGRNWATRSGAALVPLTSYVDDAWTNGDVNVTADSVIVNGSANSVRFAVPAARTLTLSGVNAVAAGILVTPDVGANTTTIAGGTLTSGNLYINQMNTAGDLTLATPVAGPQLSPTNLTKMGPGTVLLATQTNLGTLTISSGVLKIGHPAALAPTSRVSVAGTLDLNGFSQTIGSLFTSTHAAGGIIDNASPQPVTLTIREKSTFFGTIQNTNGVVSLNLTGSHTFFAPNTYSGPTTLDHGSLSLFYLASPIDPAPSNILPFTTTLHLISGTLSFPSEDRYTRTQTLAAVNLVSGASIVSQPFLATGTTLLNLGPLTRTPGATVDLAPFPGSDPSLGMTTTTITPADTPLGGWATANTTDWATTAGGRVAPLSPAAYTPNLLAPGTNSDITTSFATASPTTATLRFTGTSSAPSTLTLLGATIIESGGILQTASVTQTHLVTGGSLTSGNGSDLILHTYRTANALTLASPITDNGTTPIGLTKSGPGTLELAATSTYSGPTAINAGTLRLLADQPNLHAITGDGILALAPAVTATASSLQLPTLTLSGTLTLRPSTTPSASTLTTLTLAGTTNNWTALLDLTNAPLLIQATTSNKTATLSTLQNQLTYAKTHPAGLTSSTTTADPTHKTTLLIDNALLTLTTFYNQPADTNSLLLLSTWYGDSNLDRKVNVTDLGTLATYYGQPAAAFGPLKGDFNNDSLVNVTDLGLLATNYGQGTTPGATYSLESDQLQITNYQMQTTPEPATLALLLPALLLRRRPITKHPLTPLPPPC